MSKGSFIWYELVTSDPAAAADFYKSVVGWHAHGFDGPVADYTLFDAPDGLGVAGMMQLPPEAPMKPGWFGYIGVEDVDAVAAQAEQMGAALHMPPEDIPGVGRFAMLADRQGVAFYIMRGDSPEGSHSFAPRTPGHIGWNELHTTHWQDAFEFYRGLFGWVPGHEMDMGPMGKYALFQIGDVDAGAIFNSPAPIPAWLYYFNVADLAAAAERVKANGGTILQGPIDVPDGQCIVQAQDPQGALFALVGPGPGA